MIRKDKQILNAYRTAIKRTKNIFKRNAYINAVKMLEGSIKRKQEAVQGIIADYGTYNYRLGYIAKRYGFKPYKTRRKDKTRW